MTILLLLLGPTLLIFLGLQVIGSVPVTFLLFYSWLFLVPLADFYFVKKGSRRDILHSLGIHLHRKNVLLGLAFGAVFLLCILIVGSFFHTVFFDKNDLLQLLARWNFSGNLIAGLIAILMLVNPILEEVYWRGYMHQKLSGKHKPGAVILMTALFYSLYHFLSVVPLFAWPYNVLMVVPVFLAGVIWGYMRQQQHSLVGSIISHILADVGIMGIYLLFIA
ncbi:CPBP family intramembrane glutamic endopeptidase [Brevibacillus sp. NRS-1366]|uniref:CPBP family intramembrane glutamic endopeptidase n=1 Tax=Brevibacillus sp. NRS-1366 TaxID=3233899 RepID=UPI003D20CA81